MNTDLLKRHEFNSNWCNDHVGIVTSLSFFDLNKLEIFEQLNNFSWVEFKSPTAIRKKTRAVYQNGFRKIDTQLKMHLDLRSFNHSHVDGLYALTAAEMPLRFESEMMKPFKNERFNQITTIKQDQINKRYQLWGEELILRSPNTCVGVYREGLLQGWFLTELINGVLDITLAVLHIDSTTCGEDLYYCALRWFKECGYGKASSWFSASNIPVLNIFSGAGAIFSVAQDLWIWEKEKYCAE